MINRELTRLKVVQLVYAFYRNDGKTLDVAEKELDYSLNKAYELYQYLLNTLVEVHDYALRKADAEQTRAVRLGGSAETVTLAKRFAQNKFLTQLAANEELAAYREKKKHWSEEAAFIKKTYESMIDSEVFNNYFTQNDFSYEAEKEIVRKLYKTYICNNDAFSDMLEDHSLYWNDDKEIVDSFVIKTIKRFEEKNGEKQELLPIYSEEEDQNFGKELFTQTISNSEQIKKIITENAKNWEYSRLAFMDVVIMQIALTEILYFPLIPIGVTFNEYLDIAKVYSTPKSARYINGLLDNVVKTLKKEGKISK